MTDDKGHRTSHSAMASYPLEVYLLAGNVTDLPDGVYLLLAAGLPENKKRENLGQTREEDPIAVISVGRK